MPKYMLIANILVLQELLGVQRPLSGTALFELDDQMLRAQYEAYEKVYIQRLLPNS